MISIAPRRRRPVMMLALALSLACHLALLGWLTLRPEGSPAPRSIDVVLVAKSDESRIAAPAAEATQPAPPRQGPAQPAPATPADAAAGGNASPPAAARADAAPAAVATARTPQAGSETHATRASPRDPPAVAAPRPAAAARETLTAGLRLAIRQRLAEYLNYPPAARRRAIEGDPVVRFIIARDGSLLHHELAESSGSRHLDRAALKLVRDAAPYPGFPPGLELAQLEVQLPIEYRLARRPST